MDKKSRRLFVGIPIEQGVKDSFGKFFAEQKVDGDFRWTFTDNLHITLVFKGETPQIYIPEIMEKLAEYFKGKPQFDLLFQAYTFMPHRNPRMFWANFQPDPIYKMLVSGVSQILKVIENRSPMPHITLARFKQDADYKKINIELAPQISSFKVSKAYLYESVLQPSGPEYKILDNYFLS